VEQGMSGNPGALKKNLTILSSMLTNLNKRQDEFGTMLSLAAEYTKGINLNGEIITALSRNLANFLTEFEQYGSGFAYAVRRLADMLERVKGIMLEYDTTIDPLVRKVDAIGRQYGPLLARYEPLIAQGRDLIKRLQGMVGPDGSIQIDHSNLVLSTDYCIPVPGVTC